MIKSQAETKADAVFELLILNKKILFPFVGEPLGFSVISGQSVNS
jgi:hypothetical protein